MNREITGVFLRKCAGIFKGYQEEIDREGVRFNVFSILNVESKEVRLHSKFISELLNNRGTHGNKNNFFNLFVQQLQNLKIERNGFLKNFNSENYTVKTDVSIGLINEDYTTGGNIDILIEDSDRNKIIIENKIFASDQKNQLLRYYNHDKNSLLIYLTLDGKEPSSDSTNNQLVNNNDFFCLSYKSFIANWLEFCIQNSASKPRICETIKQYHHIIKDYTNQNINQMQEDVIKLIESDFNIYNSIDEINNAYYLFKKRINDKFWKNIRIKSERLNNPIFITSDRKEIHYRIAEDGGFYFGFYFKDNTQKNICLNREEFEYYKNVLNEKDKSRNPKFNSNENHIVWIFSNFINSGKKFLDLNK